MIFAISVKSAIFFLIFLFFLFSSASSDEIDQVVRTVKAQTSVQLTDFYPCTVAEPPTSKSSQNSEIFRIDNTVQRNMLLTYCHKVTYAIEAIASDLNIGVFVVNIEKTRWVVLF